jgi:DNA-binding CsgD family transcriptional regulator/DNA-binding MarR family transcriptional regulator
MHDETPNPASEFFDIRSPELVKAVGDSKNLCVWQAIRSSDCACSVAEVAAQLGETQAHVRTCIDSLTAAGLLVRVPCNKDRRSTTWKVACDSLTILYREGDPHDEEIRQSIFRMIDSDRKHEVESKFKPVSEQIPGKDANCIARLQVRLNKEDVKVLWDRLNQMFAWIESRTGIEPSSGNAADAPQSRDCNYHIALDLQPLLPGVHPMATVQLLSKRNESYWKGAVTNAVVKVLSAREYLVAEQMALGSTNAAIATRLKLSPNTVATYARRIFRKLGITRRSQIAQRMHSAQ